MASKNSITVTVEEFKILLKTLPTELPIFLWGQPGVGKSAGAHQAADEESIGFKDVRLTTIDPTDLRGFPYIDQKQNMAVWARPGLLPDAERDGERGILILDEINSAHQSIQAAAYQLVLDRKIGDSYVLPKGWRVVAAGNRAEDRSVTYELPMALANRFLHVEVSPDMKCWQNWALENDINHDVIAFLAANPELACPPVSDGAQRAYPSFRTWEYVSKILKGTSHLHEKLESVSICGSVGEAAGAQFAAFRRLKNELPDMDTVFDGGHFELPKKADVQYAFYSAFCAKLDDRSHAREAFMKTAVSKPFVHNFLQVVTGTHREFVELILQYMARKHNAFFLRMLTGNPEVLKAIGLNYAELAAAASMTTKK